MGMFNILGGGDSHKSNVARLGAGLDPTHYFFKAVGLKAADPHTYLTPIADKTNGWFSKVSKPVNQFMTKITPGKQYLDDHVPILKSWNQTVENRPVDALGIAASTVFGGGALMGAAGGAGAGAGAAGAPAASTAGGMGGLGGMAGASSAITPTFASGLGAAPAAGGALMSGTGTLGAAGTAAGMSSLTPYFASTGAAAPATGLFGNMTTMDKINNAKSIFNYANSSANNRQNTNYATYNPDLGVYGYNSY
jgi:hypothetical protein